MPGTTALDQDRVRILLIVDDRGDREAIARHLQKPPVPYRVQTALTPGEARRLLGEAEFHVAIVDFALGEGAGSERRGIKLDAERRRQHAEQAALAARVGRLTHRELEVLRLTAEGYALKQVAAMLNCSYKTVDKHKVNLMKKLEVHDRVELAHLAVKARLIQP